MAEFPPVRVLYDGADTVGLSEFQEFEFIAVSSGGTGASSVTDVAASLNILSSLSSLGDTSSTFEDVVVGDAILWDAVNQVWSTSAIDHDTNLQNVGTNTHAAIDSHIASASVHFTQGSIQRSHGITFETPVSGDLLPIFATNVAITITEILHACTGATSVVWAVVHGNRPDSTTNTALSGTAVTSITSETSISGDDTVPLDSYVNIDVSAITGSPTVMTMTVFYTED